MKSCQECKFLMLRDTGYSNWTVEGTDAICLHNENPNLPADNYYGKAPELEYAEQCALFSEGIPTHLDVEREYGAAHNYATDATVKLMLILEEND